MTTTNCPYCGREIEPCANCGGTHGVMVQTHGQWIHKQLVDCIVHLQTKLKSARDRVTDLERDLSGDIQAITDDGQQHRIRHSNWRPYPPSLYEYDQEAPAPID